MFSPLAEYTALTFTSRRHSPTGDGHVLDREVAGENIDFARNRPAAAAALSNIGAAALRNSVAEALRNSVAEAPRNIGVADCNSGG